MESQVKQGGSSIQGNSFKHLSDASLGERIASEDVLSRDIRTVAEGGGALATSVVSDVDDAGAGVSDDGGGQHDEKTAPKKPLNRA